MLRKRGGLNNTAPVTWRLTQHERDANAAGHGAGGDLTTGEASS
jgi:hypothetical protein